MGPFPPSKSGRWVVGWLGGSACVGTCQWSSTVGCTPLLVTCSEVRHAADFKIISTNWLKNWKKYLVIRSIFQLLQNDRYLRLNHRTNDSPNRPWTATSETEAFRPPVTVLKKEITQIKTALPRVVSVFNTTKIKDYIFGTNLRLRVCLCQKLISYKYHWH